MVLRKTLLALSALSIIAATPAFAEHNAAHKATTEKASHKGHKNKAKYKKEYYNDHHKASMTKKGYSEPAKPRVYTHATEWKRHDQDSYQRMNTVVRKGQSEQVRAKAATFDSKSK